MVDVINKYEAGVKNSAMMKLFMEEFEAKRIGIANEQALIDPLAIPKFGEMENGQFLAIEKNGGIFVFPNPALTANHVTVVEQETAFFVDIHHLTQGQCFHVVRPAVLKRTADSFERVERGQLRVY